MPKSLTAFILTTACLLAPATASAQSDRGDRLYRMTLLRAAPGRVLDLVQDVKARVAALPADIKNMKSLRWLRLEGSRLSEGQKASVTNALPDCLVVF